MESLKEEDLKHLSPRAIVAFATRCAERVLPIYTANMKGNADELPRAIGLLIAFSRDRFCSDDSAIRGIHQAGYFASNAALFAGSSESPPYRVAQAVHTACLAALACFGRRNSVSGFAMDAEEHARKAAPDDATVLSDCDAADLKKLLAMKQDTSSDPMPPINYDELGGLWPDVEKKPQWAPEWA